MVTRRIAGTTMANPIILVATIAWRSLVSLGLWIPKKNPIKKGIISKCLNIITSKYSVENDSRYTKIKNI